MYHLVISRGCHSFGTIFVSPLHTYPVLELLGTLREIRSEHNFVSQRKIYINGELNFNLTTKFLDEVRSLFLDCSWNICPFLNHMC